MMFNSAGFNVGCLKILGFVSIVCCTAGAATAAEPLLTVKQVMNGVITPSTNIVW
jgi:hypothetical protein